MKICSNCGGLGPFGANSKAKDGLKSCCKKCCAEKQATYRVQHPEVWANWAAVNAEHLKTKDAARYAADPEGEKARVLAYQTKNPEKVKVWLARSNLAKYGITPEDKQALFDRQGGKCGVCGCPLLPGRAGMQVDHDHATGTVRGLLCWNCNVMIGDFGEDLLRLEGAIRYLGQGLVTGLTHQERPSGIGWRSRGTRAGNLWYLYGLTEVSFQELFGRQGGRCGICPTPLRRDAHVDHDHRLSPRKGLRGLLCRLCNLGLGHARDDVRVLLGAIRYLETAASSGVSSYAGGRLRDLLVSCTPSSEPPDPGLRVQAPSPAGVLALEDTDRRVPHGTVLLGQGHREPLRAAP